MNKKNILIVLFYAVAIVIAIWGSSYFLRIYGIRTERADLDNNKIKEIYTLGNGHLVVAENAKTIWQSPDDWRIDNFVLADSNNDGVIDINLSVWKAGDFGSSKPFWVKVNDMSVKNHFFVFDYVNGAVKPIWQSSNLEAPNCKFKISDVDNDGKNELIVLEGDYSQKLMCLGDYVAIWEWNGWGFSNDWRSEKGYFSLLMFEKIGGESNIADDSF